MREFKLYILCMSMGMLLFFIAPAFSDGGLTPAEEKAVEAYTVDLKDLVKKAEKGLQKVEKKIKAKEKDQRNVGRELEIREMTTQGEVFYEAGKYDEAEAAWARAVELSNDPEMKEYIRLSKVRAEKEKKERDEEEKLRIKRLDEIYNKVSQKQVDVGAHGRAPLPAATVPVQPIVIETPKAEPMKIEPGVGAQLIAPQKEVVTSAPVKEEQTNVGANDYLPLPVAVPPAKPAKPQPIWIFVIVGILILIIAGKLLIGNIPKVKKVPEPPTCARKKDEFNPRELGKFLDKKPESKDKDLFE